MYLLTDEFYARLPVYSRSLSQLLTDPTSFRPVPRDWHVIVTDIRGSTIAIANGQHNEVNLIATGSIAAVMNIIYRHGLCIPFFFGGDGATFLVPPAFIAEIMQALSVFKGNIFKAYHLDLRTGSVPVCAIYEKGYELRLCKFRNSATLTVPVLLGGGLVYAESLVKGSYDHLDEIPTPEGRLDLAGMECRWDQILPPLENKEVVTLLAIASDVTEQPAVFSELITQIDKIYGAFKNRQPISVARLRYQTTLERLETEMLLKTGKVKLWALLWGWIKGLYSFLNYQSQGGRAFLKQIVAMSDTLVVDGRINTVISGTPEQRTRLLKYLDEQESGGRLLYGMHLSGASVMSCYVSDNDHRHIHFVDGSGGGYTQASRILKAKSARASQEKQQGPT